MSNAARALHKRWQATGYDWERLLAGEMCRASVGASAFGNFGCFRRHGLSGAKAQLFRRFQSRFRWERRSSVADVVAGCALRSRDVREAESGVNRKM